MTSNGIFNRGLQNFNVLIKNELLIIFNEEAIPKIKELIMDDYRAKLNGVANDSFESLRPESYESSFEEALNNFNYISESGDGLSLTYPSMDGSLFEDGNFSFIRSLMEGIDKNYYKVSSLEYNKFSNTEYELPVYLVAEDNPFINNFDINSLEKFEFSKNPPIDIMNGAREYIKGNMPIWIRRAIAKAELNLKNYMNGVNRT